MAISEAQKKHGVSPRLIGLTLFQKIHPRAEEKCGLSAECPDITVKGLMFCQATDFEDLRPRDQDQYEFMCS